MFGLDADCSYFFLTDAKSCIGMLSVRLPNPFVEGAFPCECLSWSIESSWKRHASYLCRGETLKLDHVIQDLPTSVVRLTPILDVLLLDEIEQFFQALTERNYHAGILLQKTGQHKFQDMLADETMTGAFDDFLKVVGRVVHLKNHEGYCGKLDSRGWDTTGSKSVYAVLPVSRQGQIEENSELAFQNLHLMFHIAKWIPTEERIRILSQERILVIFRESGSPKIDLSSFGDHVQFLLCIEPLSQQKYRIQCVSSKTLKPFRPFVPDPPILQADELFRFVVLKCINATRADDEPKMEMRRRILKKWSGMV